jgi:hypothetical protein
VRTATEGIFNVVERLLTPVSVNDDTTRNKQKNNFYLFEMSWMIFIVFVFNRFEHVIYDKKEI